MRSALAAIVFCATMLVCAQIAPAPAPTAPDGSSAGTTVQAAQDCAPGEDERAWRRQHDSSASITQSPWKSRSLHAVLSAIPRPGVTAATGARSRPSPLAPDAPPYLLHTPLLI
jgi:hypothetical protein